MRNQFIDSLNEPISDIFICGGGINGAICSLALAKQSLKVTLIDQDDFGSFTSQNSSNLVWGGIKYLENREFSLVRKLCKARNQLLKSYPHRVKEIRFATLISEEDKYDPWQILAGTWLYWLLGSKFTKRPERFFKEEAIEKFPELNGVNFEDIIEYSDGYLPNNDSRFVFRFIKDAIESGASCLNYTKLEQATFNPSKKIWYLTVLDLISGKRHQTKSRYFINAGGPFTESISHISNLQNQHKHIFSKGAHLVVNKSLFSDKILTFFAEDGRPFFIIPMGNFSCIGTTDSPVASPHSKISEDDRDFILDNINKKLGKNNSLTKDNIIYERCGVRPLVVPINNSSDESKDMDWTQLSRKHVIEKDSKSNAITIYGGKLTDCLNIGAEIIEIFEKEEVLPLGEKPWIGEPPINKELAKTEPPQNTFPVSHQILLERYGDDCYEIYKIISDNKDSQKLIDKNLPYMEAEFYYMKKKEYVVKLEDCFRRRTLISHSVPYKNIIDSDALQNVSKILFDEESSAKWQEFISETKI